MAAAFGLVLVVAGALLTGCAAPKEWTAVIAMTATSAEPVPGLAEPLRLALEDAASASEQAGVPDVRLVLLDAEPVDIDLTPIRDGEVEFDPMVRPQMIDDALAALSEELGRRVALRPELDVLDTLRAAARAGGDGPIYLITSGISTVDPVNFAALGWDFDPQAVAADLADRGLLPSLDGRSVTFVGLGVSAGSQPPLAEPEEDKVRELWLAVCRAAGAADCAAVDGVLATGSTAPGSRQPVTVVPVPHHGTTRGPESVDLAGAVLFDGDSAILRPAADAVLRGLVAHLAQCGEGARVDVTGHVADVVRGVPENGPLSDERARAVANRLLQLGLPESAISRVVGVGDSQTVIDNWTGDVFDEAKAARNRRVTLTYTC
ncbi:MAG: OmpA family protein [Frankia sp.]|nr:OmpA family protein [Frankia sp.]